MLHSTYAFINIKYPGHLPDQCHIINKKEKDRIGKEETRRDYRLFCKYICVPLYKIPSDITHCGKYHRSSGPDNFCPGYSRQPLSVSQSQTAAPVEVPPVLKNKCSNIKFEIENHSTKSK